MTFVPIMWIVWGASVLLMAALHLCRSSMEKNEDDQIFLDDSFGQEQSAQSEIVSKVQKIQPWLRASQWLAAALTVFVIAYYVWDFLNVFHIIG